MGRCIKCTWEGVEYESIREASQETGIPYGRLASWLRKGKPKKGRKVPCTWNGIQYPSIREAADANWITPVGMWFRLHKGYTCDEDMLK